MSALTRTPSNKSSRPEYKDYVNFLQSYREDNKLKQDSQDTVDFSKNCPSFNSYLEKYNNKKFSSVKLNLGDENGKTKTMKSEIFIEVTAPKIEQKISIFENNKPPLKNKPDIKIHPLKLTSPSNQPVKIQPLNIPKPPAMPPFKMHSSPKTDSGIPPAPAMPLPVKQGMTFATPKLVQSTIKPNMSNQKLDKNDPVLRKLVYGTLRGMYGAYHEKANDFMATLPKNMVKKDNGIQNIINTIASNGDLDKLNGRSNPKFDQE